MNQSIAYLNGEYQPLSDAKISVLDRGFIFGDGVYEVIPVYGQQAFRLEQHLQRLQNSLDAIRITNPHTLQEWQELIEQLIKKNTFTHSSIYLQITRGIAKRDHAFPIDNVPTVFMMANPMQEMDDITFDQGIAAITLDDIRWQYCNIKSIALLANILLKQTAIDEGAQEAILVRNGEVTEGSASNVFIVSEGKIKTPPKGSKLLPGITRDLVVELARENNLPIEEVFFSRPELEAADEIWLTSSTKEILPVVKLNNQTINGGKPGDVARRMFAIYKAYKNGLKQNVPG